jgi:uncharacterized protein (TIGR02646 family)
MIKIDKSKVKMPASLNSDLTKKRRNELIEAGKYIYKGVYDSRYKGSKVKDENQGDVQKALRNLYNDKCVFCESCIELSAVEHFRPKAIYYWLAYSWDNLLLICTNCNSHKREYFEKLKQSNLFHKDDLANIHSLTQKYNQEEQSQFIHPELEDVEEEIDFDFDKNCLMSSANQRVDYTISKLKLNERNFLINQRKAIYDNLMNKGKDRFLKYQIQKAKGEKENSSKTLYTLKGFLEDFKIDSQNEKKTYLALRRNLVRNNPLFSILG